MADPLRFDGRVVLVAGDTGAIADRFREAGAEVVDAIDALDRRLDAVVSHAGPPPDGNGSEAIERNLLGPIELAQQAYALMQNQPDGGAIVFVLGLSALRPSPEAPAYGAAEAGLVNLVTTLALEWGPDVRVNCVSASSAEDAADACLFLASAGATHVNGTTLVVDDGGEPPPYLAAASG